VVDVCEDLFFLRRPTEGYKTLEIPFYVSAAENSFAGERSFKSGLHLSDKFEEQLYFE